jgi:hypothetical protein
VVPNTAAALVAFLAFVSPGLVFELLRQRSRPALAQTTFVEISTVVLASLVFTSASLGLVRLLALWLGTWFVEPSSWLRGGWAYAADRPGRLAVTAAIELGVACLLALGAHRLLNSKQWRHVSKAMDKVVGTSGTHVMRRHSAWWEILCGRIPDGATARKVVLSLDECTLSAPLHGFDDQTIVVSGPMKIHWKQSGSVVDIDADLAQLIAVPLSSVSFAGIRYEVPAAAPSS